MANEREEFFNSLQSVSKLIGDLALNVAAAQELLDTNYIRNLKEFLIAIGDATRDLPDSAARTALIQSLAPSRYQFTETVVEVRADLQMSTATQYGGDISVGFRTPVLAAAINASYVKRSTYDHRAAALIKTVLHAVPAEPAVLEKLLEGAKAAGGAALPENAYGDLADVVKSLELPEFAGAEPEEEGQDEDDPAEAPAAEPAPPTDPGPRD